MDPKSISAALRKDPSDGKVSKESVNYQTRAGARHCGNCVMFHYESRSCDLVRGYIEPEFYCKKWEPKNGS